jgi:hypothetical protein
MFLSQLGKIQPNINYCNQIIWAYLAEEKTQRRGTTALAPKRAATSRIICVGRRDLGSSRAFVSHLIGVDLSKWSKSLRGETIFYFLKRQIEASSREDLSDNDEP